MAELPVTRRFDASPETVYEFLTVPGRLLAWWGQDGTKLPEADRDFRNEGAWYLGMQIADGGRMKMSGRITKVDPPQRISLRWLWHDEADRRGHESQLTFEIAADGGNGSTLTKTQMDLPDADWAARHERGLGSTLDRLTRGPEHRI